MDILQIFMLIVGILSIATCVLYARTNKYNNSNNLPIIVLCCAISVAITVLGIIYPSWWILGGACYGLLYLILWADYAEEKLKNRNYVRLFYKGWYTTASYQRSLKILEWGVLISEIAIPITAIAMTPWYIGLFFCPPLAIALLSAGNELKTCLKEI